MAALMKKQVFSATVSRRSAVVVQAAKTVKAVKKSSPDSAFYGPGRGQFLGPFSESCHLMPSHCGLENARSDSPLRL